MILKKQLKDFWQIWLMYPIKNTPFYQRVIWWISAKGNYFGYRIIHIPSYFDMNSTFDVPIYKMAIVRAHGRNIEKIK